MTTMISAVEYVACCHQGCGYDIIATRETFQRWRDTHEWFYCPAGHRQCFGGKSDAEREKALREKAEANARWYADQMASAQASERRIVNRLNATRGVVTRMKRRSAHGVCPCCNRSFANVARHMKGKHPLYVEASGGKP